MAKSLQELLSVLDSCEITGSEDVLIEGLSDDSRNIKKGFLFICHAGFKSDGYSYVKNALDNGAVAILTDKELGGLPATVVKVADSNTAMQKLAPHFFDYPSHKMAIIGVTGTNGKTTVTHMLRQIFAAAGHMTGVIGTIHAMSGEREIPVKNTTPDVMELQTLLAQMYNDGVKYIFMEVSSHALSLERVAGCEFDIAVLTNITQDHLDFHKTFEAYVGAKTLLFSRLENNRIKKGAKAVINTDDPSAAAIMAATGVPVVTYGLKAGNDVFPLKTNLQAKGMKLLLSTPGGELDLSIATTGHFNVYNVMAAVSAAWAAGIAPETIQSGLNAFTAVPGRFELVESGQPFTVIVDYAHTPDGLENVLTSARQIAQNKLIAVFGCGGDRDKTKRPLMGSIAARLSDHVFITSDNPRSEVPENIIENIKTGVPDKENYTTIVDRRSAIESALAEAGAGDVVVIAGKGHETYQILKDRTIDFDDRQVARDYLKGKWRV